MPTLPKASAGSGKAKTLHHVVTDGEVIFNNFDDILLGIKVPQTLANTATPSVAGSKVWLTGGIITITDFTLGFVGQEIIILSEHAITITDGTNMFLSGSANFVMADTDSLHLVQKADGNWYEVSRSVN